MGVLESMCNITYIAQGFCYSFKFLDYICVLIDFVSDAIVGKVKRSNFQCNPKNIYHLILFVELDQFTSELHEMFYVSITFEHSFHFQTKTSKTLNQVKYDIMEEIHERSESLMYFFTWMDVISGMFAFWMIVKLGYFKIGNQMFTI